MKGLAEKKGAGHFEMIISFVFFVGFVFFLFVVLRPDEGVPISGAVVSGLYDSFEEEVYTNLSDVFLKADYAGVSDCFYVELPGRIFAYGLGSGDSYVTNLGGVDVDSELVGSGANSDLNLDVGEIFFRVAISPEFGDEVVSGCEILEDYELGSINGRRVVSYSALESLANRYYVDYDGVKSDLGVPNVLDCAIISETLVSVRMEPQGGVPDSVEVVARDYVVEVLYTDGTLINEKFSFMVW